MLAMGLGSGKVKILESSSLTAGYEADAPINE